MSDFYSSPGDSKKNKWDIYKHPQWYAGKYSPYIILLLMLILAIFTNDDYGLSYDAPTQRITGMTNYNYVVNNDTTLLSYYDRDYGPAFELCLYAIEKVLPLEGEREIHLVRYFFTHLFFLFGALCSYWLAGLLFKNRLLGLIAMLLFLLHPRIYAHSFFNSKDIPFLSMFMISMYTTAKAFRRKNIANFLILGLCCGLLTNMRIAGIVLVVPILLLLVVDIFYEKKGAKNILFLTLFSIIVGIVLIATWPFLWTAPLENFIQAFRNMANFRWNGTILFFGEFVNASDLPPSYIPGWFVITTPIIYLIIATIGIIGLLFQNFKKIKTVIANTPDRLMLLYLFCFVGSVLAVIILESVMYDGWRQMYFIYAPFTILAVYGLYKLPKPKIALRLISANFIVVIAIMVYYHPYGNVYFNITQDFKESEHLRENFEMDYWGTAYKESLDYILDNDTSDQIKINTASHAGRINISLLSPEDQERLIHVKKEDAKYFITGYRWHPQKFKEYWKLDYYRVRRGRNTINTVFNVGEYYHNGTQ